MQNLISFKKYGLATILGFSLIGLSACGNSAHNTTPAVSNSLKNKAVQYVKNDLHQPAVRKWSVISTQTNTYGHFFPKAVPPQSKMKVYEINISGNMEEPLCPVGAKKGTTCKEKVVPAINHVFVAVSNGSIVAETSQSQ